MIPHQLIYFAGCQEQLFNIFNLHSIDVYSFYHLYFEILNIKSILPSIMPRGHLIVVEGLDRSGKSSQCMILLEDIRGHADIEVKYLKFPDRTTATGQLINGYLTGQSEQSDQAIHLLFSANRWEAASEIINDLNNGITIVIDRYSFSGAVYSAAKGDAAMSLDWCWNMEVGLPKPDLVVFLDISTEDAAKRGGYGEERYEKEEMQGKVRKLFGELFERLDVEVVKVDAGRVWGRGRG